MNSHLQSSTSHAFAFVFCQHDNVHYIHADNFVDQSKVQFFRFPIRIIIFQWWLMTNIITITKDIKLVLQPQAEHWILWLKFLSHHQINEQPFCLRSLEFTDDDTTLELLCTVLEVESSSSSLPLIFHNLSRTWGICRCWMKSEILNF